MTSTRCSRQRPDVSTSRSFCNNRSMKDPKRSPLEQGHLPFFPRFIFLTLRDQGHDEAALFTGLNLTASQLNDEHYRLTKEQHEQFVLRALELTNNPHLALDLSQHFAKASNLAVMAIANSGQVAKALHLLMRFNSMITRTFTIRSLTLEDEVVMEIDPHVDHPRVAYFALGAFVLFVDRLFQPVLGNEHIIRCAQFSVPMPEGFAQVQKRFGFPITFGHATSRIFFKAEYLDQPMRQADPQTVRLIMETCEKALLEAESEMGIVGRVKSLMIDNLAAPPKLGEAATYLGVSSSGLRRKLAAAGTSYQVLLDAIRLEVSTKLLQNTAEPIANIAYELGFTNASDFGRAYRKWSGRPPSAARKARAN